MFERFAFDRTLCLTMHSRRMSMSAVDFNAVGVSHRWRSRPRLEEDSEHAARLRLSVRVQWDEAARRQCIGALLTAHVFEEGELEEEGVASKDCRLPGRRGTRRSRRQHACRASPLRWLDSSGHGEGLLAAGKRTRYQLPCGHEQQPAPRQPGGRTSHAAWCEPYVQHSAPVSYQRSSCVQPFLVAHHCDAFQPL